MNLTPQDVQDILDLLDASGFEELHFQSERFSLFLRRSAHGGWTQETVVTALPNIVPTAAETSRAPSSTPAGTHAAEGLFEVRAHLIGTFYRAPKPGAPPFVEIGSRVEQDTVVAIIETMKLMNSVPAGMSGEIVEICLADAQFVEQGAVLMRIRPDS